MNELTTMEAALRELRAALDDDPDLLAIRISTDVLGNAVTAAKDSGVNAARVNDLEFALNDLVSAVDDAGAPDAVLTAVAVLQNGTAALRRTNALSAETVAAIRASCRAGARARKRSSAASTAWKAPTRRRSRTAPAELLRAGHPTRPTARRRGFTTPSLDEIIALRIAALPLRQRNRRRARSDLGS